MSLAVWRYSLLLMAKPTLQPVFLTGANPAVLRMPTAKGEAQAGPAPANREDRD